MPTVPTVDDFMAFFPQFEESRDMDVQAAIIQAMVWVDPLQWDAADYPAGLLYLAAHFLELAEEAAAVAAASSTGETTGSSGAVQTYLSRVSIGDRSVMWRAPPGGAGKTGGASRSSTEDLFDLTTFGQMYLQLRARNIAPIVVLNKPWI